MSHTATLQKSIPEAVLDRVLIAIFLGICLLLCNTLLAAVKDGVLYFSLAALLELFIIQAMRGLFGNTPLIQDANELNFYAFLIHLIAIPLFLRGVQSDWHNNSIIGLNVFYLARLFYFGERRADGEFTGWAKFGVLAWTLFFINKAANTLTRQRVVFALRLLITAATIVPLWVITAQTNDQTTSLYTVLTTAFILIYGYVKNILASRKISQTETLLNDETIALCKAYNARTSDARQMIQRIAVEDFTVPTRGPLTARKAFDMDARLGYAVAQIEELERQRIYWMLGAVFIMAISAWTIHSEEKAMFKFGYATGYTDGKAGAKPKSETSWDRVALCHNRDWRQGPAPDSCLDEPAKK